MRCRAEKVITALFLAAATHWLRTFFYVKVVESAFLKGKVSALLGEGQSERQVSRKVGVPKSTVHRWRANDFSLYRKVGSGRRRKTSSEADRLIVRLVRNDPSLSSTELRSSLQNATVSALTVRRRLRNEHFKSRKRPSGIELTANHKRLRLEWVT